MHELEVPDALAGVGLQRDQRVGVEVGAEPVAAPEVERGRPRRHEDEPAGLVDGHARPVVGGTDALPGVGRPGLVPRLARTRNGVEDPPALSGAHVERADVPGRGAARPFREPGGDDDDVLVDAAGRAGEHGEAGGVGVEPEAQIDAALLAERRDGRARVGVERIQVRPGPHQDALVGALGPVGDAAIHPDRVRAIAAGLREGIEDPLLRARGRIECEDLQLGRRGIEHAVDDDRVALDLRAVVGAAIAGPVGPGDLQARDVGRSDQVGGRVLRVRGVGAVRAPVDLRDTRLRPRMSTGQNDDREGDQGGQSATHREVVAVYCTIR